MIQISEERRAWALKTLAETRPVRLSTSGATPDAYQGFLDLAECETVEMPAVEGFPWRIRLFWGKNRGEKCPIHINVHGGGFFSGYRDNDVLWSSWLAHQIGGIIVDVDYSVSADGAAYPIPVEQCYMAAQWTFQHGESLGGDPERISMGGYSAGANLTAAICLKAVQTKEFQLCLQVLGYPNADAKTPALYKAEGYEYDISPARGEAFATLYFGNDPVLAEDPLISAVYASDEMLSQVPRALVLTAGYCNFRFEDERYAQRMAELGVEVTVKRFLDSRHGFIPHFMKGWEDAGSLIARTILDARL